MAAHQRMDSRGMERAATRLLRVAEGLDGPRAAFYGVLGHHFLGTIAVVRADAAGVRMAADAAEALLPSIPENLRRELLPNQDRLRRDAARLGGRPAEARGGAATSLRRLLGLPPGPPGEEASPALLRMCLPDPSALDEVARVDLAQLLVFDLARGASVRGLSGETVAWLDAAEPLLPTLPMEVGIRLLSLWYELHCAEAGRRSAPDEAHRALEAALRILRGIGAPPALVEEFGSLMRDAGEVQLAMWAGNLPAAKAAARRIVASRHFRAGKAHCTEFLRAIAADDDNEAGRILAGVRLRPDSPTLNDNRLLGAMERLRAGDEEAGVAVLIGILADGLLDEDRDLAFDVPAILAHLLLDLAASGDPAATLAPAALLKAAARGHEAIRLDITRHARHRLEGMGDDWVRDCYALLRDLLVAQGRIGEAIRVDALLEQEEAAVPRPADGALAAMAARRVPFTAREEAFWSQVAATAGLVRHGRIAATPSQWLRGLGTLAQLGGAADAAAERRLEDDDDWDGGPGEAQLGYLVHRDHLLVRLRAGDQVVVCEVRLGAPDALAACVYGLERAVRAPDRGHLDATRRAWDLLVAPVADALDDPSITTVVVEGTGLIPRIPFAALHDGRAPLVRRCATALHGARRLRPGHSAMRGGRPLAASLTVSNAPGMPPLLQAATDGAVVEAAARARGWEVLSRADGQATGAALAEALRRGPAILHLSSHFEADPAEMGRSAFVLGGGERVRLEEFARHDLSPIDLALLMGCETLSRQDAGGGIGLDAALLRLGVNSVLGSLWSIEDEVAGFVLERFLEGHLGAGLGRAEALRQAQLALLDAGDGRLDHPHFWAPYVVSGDWR
ncbi:CHAT domain-containing protein [Belnapia rosea]|uniref:CHAT domain-containing protein n=2 Tax=Belnapia rosea TaxID=938405 RepID=UPI0015A067E6|nr:CHAT domain-containing protein [Belnapia rosea]